MKWLILWRQHKDNQRQHVETVSAKNHMACYSFPKESIIIKENRKGVVKKY